MVPAALPRRREAQSVMDRLAAIIVDEGKWLTISMSVAFLALMLLFHRHRHADLPARGRIMAGMNLFFGVTIGTMAFGHLLAVTTKHAMGTLQGSPPFLYAIGIALAVPGWWLSHHARRMLVARGEHGRATVVLNTWLAITLAGLGFANLPLVAPALLNVGYHLHSRRLVGRAIACLAVVINVGLFIGSVMFLASGQTFEQFSGMRQ